VPLRIALPAGPMVERGRGDPLAAETVGAVVAAADPHRLPLQPTEHQVDGGMPAGLDFRSDFRGAAGGQQADALGVRQRQVERCHPRVYPPAGVLPRFRERLAVEFRRVPPEDRAADPLDRRRVDLAAGGQDRLEVSALPVAGDQLADLDPAGGSQFPQGSLQRAGGQLGAGIASPYGRDALLAGDRVLAGEQPMDRLLAGDPLQARAFRQAAQPPAG
jgi:hypothetical protein